MSVYAELQNYINEFNKNNNCDLDIDSIRIEFSKEHKLKELKQIGEWKKLEKNSNMLSKLKKRLAAKEVTSAYQLQEHDIYFYNSNKDKPKYRKAILVVFGMKQYHKEKAPINIVKKIVNIITNRSSKNSSNIDICFDMNKEPKLSNLSAFFNLKQYVSNSGIKTDTYYINETYNKKIEKVCIYDKAFKNKLDFKVWRIEATINIPNLKSLDMPLYDFKNIIELAKG